MVIKFDNKVKSKYLKYCWELNVNMFDTEKVGSLTCMEKKIKWIELQFVIFQSSTSRRCLFTSFYFKL